MDAIADLIGQIDAYIAHETRPCVCTNGWTEDGFWQPCDGDLKAAHQIAQRVRETGVGRDPFEREPHDGLVPCGFCNHGGWDHDIDEPMPVEEGNDVVLLRQARTALTNRRTGPIRLVFVSGPYSLGPEECTNNAIDVGAALAAAGFDPMVPHLNHFWDERHPADYEQWLRIDLAWVAQAHAVLRIPGPSTGADREVARAEELGIPVYRWEGPHAPEALAAVFADWAATQ